MGPDYFGEATRRWRENIDDVRLNPQTRIPIAQALADKTGTSFRLLRHQLLTDQAAAVHYAKVPAQVGDFQNPPERC